MLSALCAGLQDVDDMLITIEGIDGSGKTTVWRELKSVFPDFIFTQEPTDSEFGRFVKNEVGKSSDPFYDLFLFMADHALHVKNVIKPALARGNIVICDRYIDSRIAYQGSALKEKISNSFKWIRDLHAWSIFPDLTILLDISPEKSLERCAGRNSKMKFEDVKFLRKVRSAYLKMAEEEERFAVISAERPLTAVFKNVKKLITEALSSRV